MLNSWVLLAGTLAIAGAFLAGDIHGHRSEATTWRAKIEQARAEASEAARKTEREQQEVVNHALSEQYWAMAGIRDGLLDDIERLRNRPERPTGVPQAASPAACVGATGRELSADDASVLIRIAALCAATQADLIAYRRYADAVTAPLAAR